MKYSLVAAVAKDQTGSFRVLGKNNKLPWHLPADMKYFRQLTVRHVVVMGRKTFESIGKPLPGRLNVILSRNPKYIVDGCITVSSLEEVENIPNDDFEKEIMIIGGAQIYRLALPFATTIYLTKVYTEVNGDAFFPTLDMNEWTLVSRNHHQADETNKYEYEFLRYKRK